MHDPNRSPLRRSLARALVMMLIGASVVLQLAATARLLCPPRSIAGLSWLRVGCSPRLWPFIDYPMFSDPHVPCDPLAWIDVHALWANGKRVEQGSFEVRRLSPAEPWDRAYAREETRLRARFEPELFASGARLVLVRERLVLGRSGLVRPPCDDCPDVKQ